MDSDESTLFKMKLFFNLWFHEWNVKSMETSQWTIRFKGQIYERFFRKLKIVLLQHHCQHFGSCVQRNEHAVHLISSWILTCHGHCPLGHTSPFTILGPTPFCTSLPHGNRSEHMMRNTTWVYLNSNMALQHKHKDFRVIHRSIPLAQSVDHGAIRASIKGSIPRECMNWSNVYLQCSGNA